MSHKCNVCGKTINSKYPYCNTCFENIKKRNQSAFKTIIDEWKLEAKEEDPKYFYFVDEANDILSGRKNLVIGRKGEGKTAIAQHIYQSNSHYTFTEKLSFKDFPFNVLYKLINDRYTKPNQYISIWKYLIYTTICKKMIANEAIDSDIVSKLKKIFPPDDNKKQLSKLIEKYTVKDFGIQILGSGINIGGEKIKSDVDWIEIIDILENAILENIDDSNYYILFDELDEDYKDFKIEAEKENYFDLVTGLFKAVQDVKTLFKNNKINVYPVVFLRTDIFDLITYSDKNKWSDSIINLTWTPDKLKKLLAYRLGIVFEDSTLSFDDCWNNLFSKKPLWTGANKKKRINSFEYMLRSTQNRPRDFIKYFQECAKQVLANNGCLVNQQIIKLADSDFSEYMRNEIIDEIYSVLPEYEEIFAILSLIRKQTFNPQEFVDKYDEMVKDGEIQNRGAEKVLKLLFEYSVIGNAPSIKNQSIYKYEKNNARFNFREKIIIHRGLFKALQIF